MKRMYTKIMQLSLVVAFMGAIGAYYLTGASAATATIYLSPASATVAVNNTVNVAVRVNTGGAPIDVANITLQYDATKLEFLSVSTNGSTLSAGANYTNNGNTIAGGAYTMSPVSGDVLLFTAAFKAKASSGTAPLQFMTTGPYATEVVSGGNPVGATLANSTITFNAGSCPAGTSGTPPNCTQNTTPKPTPAPAPKPAPSQPTTGGTSAGGQQSSSTTGGEPVVKQGDDPAPSSSTVSGADATAPAASAGTLIPLVRIIVLDKAGQPLRHKTVTLHSDPMTTKTNESGVAEFRDVQPGEHMLVYTEGDKEFKQQLLLDATQLAASANGSVSGVTVKLDYTKPAYRTMALFGIAAAGIVAIFGALVLLQRRRAVAEVSRHVALSPLPQTSPQAATPATEEEPTLIAQVPSVAQPQPGQTIEPRVDDEGRGL